MAGGRALRGALALSIAITMGCGGKASATRDEPGSGAQGGSGPSAGGSTAAGGTEPHPAAGGAQHGGQAGMGTGGQSAGGVGVAGTSAAGAPGTGTCTSDAECRTVGCCEWCASYGPSEPYPSWCLVVDCAGLGCGEFSTAPVEARCVAGRCVTNISCDERLLPDDIVLPPCPDGQAHAIEPAGTAKCLSVAECASVTSCAVCESAGLSCVVHEPGGLTPFGPTFHCVDVPAECNGQPSCDCMKTCVGSAMCSEGGLLCIEFCPNC